MPLSLFEGALGGIGLFLLGMRLMSEGMRTFADTRIRRFFTLCTSNRFYSLLFGMAMSLAVNSDSAAIVFTIGLVNAGVLNSFQAMNVLGGVLIGASLTLHLNIIPYSLIATPLVFSGVVFKFFARRRRLANAGDLLLGVGLLFLGLSLLENSYRPHEHNSFYEAFNGIFYSVPSMAALFGAIISFLVQSARSSMAIIVSLLQSHQISAVIAVAMVFGGLAGVAAMGCLASVGGNYISRRIALIFLLLTTGAALLFVLFSSLLISFILPGSISFASPEGSEIYAKLAWVHSVPTVFAAVFSVLLSAPVSRYLTLSEETANQGGNSAQPCASYLDIRIINTPTLAMEQARKEIIRMMTVALFMFADIREILFDYDARRAETIRKHESVLDSLNHEIMEFLALLSRSSRNPGISYEIPGYLQIVTALEHIGDRCEEVLDSIIERKESGIIFSEDAMNDLKHLVVAVGDVMAITEETVRNGRAFDSENLYALKRETRECFEMVKLSHFDRISSGYCQPRAMLLFNDISAACIRIAEECWLILGIYVRRSE